MLNVPGSEARIRPASYAFHTSRPFCSSKGPSAYCKQMMVSCGVTEFSPLNLGNHNCRGKLKHGKFLMAQILLMRAFGPLAVLMISSWCFPWILLWRSSTTKDSRSGFRVAHMCMSSCHNESQREVSRSRNTQRVLRAVFGDTSLIRNCTC